VLVNLGADPPEDPSRFERIIEIVSREPDDEQAGRLRWRKYKGRGLEVRHHPSAG
jgi:DNA polymerase IIIc chi subunit